MISRRTVLRAGTAGTVSALANCKKASPAVTLTIGDQKGGIQSLLELSGEAGNLPYALRWAQFAAAAPLFEALNAGAVDAGIGGEAPFVFFLATRPAAQAIAALTYTHVSGNASGILVRPNAAVRGIHDLVGKRIAVVRGSTGQYVALAALRQAGLPLNAVDFTFLSPSDSLSTLLGGGVDGWGTWEPYMSLGELHYGLHPVALQIDQLAGPGFIVATSQAIHDKAPALQDFLARFQRARGWASANKSLYATGFAKDTGLPLDVAQRYVGELDYNVMPIDARSVSAVQALAALYVDAGLLTQPPPAAASFNGDLFHGSGAS